MGLRLTSGQCSTIGRRPAESLARVYCSGADLLATLTAETDVAQRQGCDVVVYAPADEVGDVQTADFAVACELAIRGYVTALVADGDAAGWWAIPGASLHAYGHKIQRLATTPAPEARPIRRILAWSPGVWERLLIGGLNTETGTTPLAWLAERPEQLALAGW